MTKKTYAVEIARDIMVAKLSSSTEATYKESGIQAADYFEEVFNRVYNIVKDDET